MNTKLLKHTRELFKSYDVPEKVRREYRRKWIRSVRLLGDKWLLSQSVQRLNPSKGTLDV
jgi:hypothetical protein